MDESYSRYSAILKEKNKTSYQVSKEANVSQNVLSNWKNGRNIPKVEALGNIADVLNVSIDYLYGRTDERNDEETKKEPLSKWHEDYKFDDVYDAMTYLNTFEQEFGRLKAFGGVFYEEMTGKEIIEHAQEVLRLQNLIANSKKD